MNLRSSAASGIRWTTLSSIVSTGSEMLRTIVVARFLSPADFGLMAMVVLVVGFAQMYTDLGIGAAIIHRQDSTRQQLSTLYWLNLLTGVFVFVLVWSCVPLIAGFFGEPKLVPLLRVVSLVFLVAPIGSQFDFLLQKDLAFGVLASRDILASIGNTIVAILGCIYGLGVWSLVWGFVANVALRTLLLTKVGMTRFRPLLHFNHHDLKGYLNFGLFQIGERTTNYAGQRLDQLLIGTVLGVQALGFYSFAFNLTAQPMYRINPILNKVAFPLFSKVQNDRERLKKGYLKLLNFLTTVNAPLLIGLAVIAPVAVPVIFGAKWSKAIVLLQLLSLVTLFRTVGNPVGNLLLAKGRADLGFKWTFAFIVLSVPAIYGGGKIGGAIGVAVSLLIIQVLLQIPAYFYLIRPVAGECGREYTIAIVKPVGLAIAMALAIALFPRIFSGFPQVLVLALQVIVGAAIYLLLLWQFHGRFLTESRDLIFARSKAAELASVNAV